MYLVASKIISPQPTFESGSAASVQLATGNRYLALEPNYLDEIPASALRRMGKTVKMGVASAMPLLREFAVDSILIGTATGGLEDCVKFLNQIVDYEEGMLTPTNFVASTPNGLAGQLAILTQNHGYNCTHTNSGLAFENALLDALMMFELGETNLALVGAVEEISSYNVNIDELAGCYKTEVVEPGQLLQTTSPGSVCGEGAAMFIAAGKSEEKAVRLRDVKTLISDDLQTVENALQDFLIRNELTNTKIDVLVNGRNGDSRFIQFYNAVSETLENATELVYKHHTGEYRTSGSFALWLGMQRLLNAPVHKSYINRDKKNENRVALVYTNFMGSQHSFILLSVD